MVPEGSTVARMGGLERVMVREWRERREAEFAPGGSWLRWE